MVLGSGKPIGEQVSRGCSSAWHHHVSHYTINSPSSTYVGTRWKSTGILLFPLPHHHPFFFSCMVGMLSRQEMSRAGLCSEKMWSSDPSKGLWCGLLHLFGYCGMLLCLSYSMLKDHSFIKTHQLWEAVVTRCVLLLCEVCLNTDCMYCVNVIRERLATVQCFFLIPLRVFCRAV